MLNEQLVVLNAMARPALNSGMFRVIGNPTTDFIFQQVILKPYQELNRVKNTLKLV